MAMTDIMGNGYETPRMHTGLIARLLPSFVFHIRSTLIVRKAGAKALRGQYGDADWAGSSLDIIRALEAVGVRLHIEGVENFGKLKGPCVIIGNHMSTLETFALPGMIRPKIPVTFVVKESLIEYPIFGPVMRSRDPILVGRTNPREDLRAVLEGGEQRLRAGISIIIFPQTTRALVFDPAEFNSIGVKLAKRAGVQVLPLALKTDAWANGTVVKEFGKINPEIPVHFRFGEPMYIKDRGTEEHQAIAEFIERSLAEWKNEAKA